MKASHRGDANSVEGVPRHTEGEVEQSKNKATPFVLTVDNINSVDPTSLTGANLKRYHHLKRYEQMMQQANAAAAVHKAQEESRLKREAELQRLERLRLQTAEGTRLARSAMQGPSASVTLAYRRGGDAKVSWLVGRLFLGCLPPACGTNDNLSCNQSCD